MNCNEAWAQAVPPTRDIAAEAAPAKLHPTAPGEGTPWENPNHATCWRPGSARKQRLGITRKIALFSWLVSVVVLLAFVAVLVPELKKLFLKNLAAQGRSLTLSLQGAAAGAVVNEEFGTAADHCMELVKADPGIVYLVATRYDGLSLVCTQEGWRREELDSSWRPAQRKAIGGITRVSLAPEPVFSFAQPMNHGGVEWGWIHAGLSLTQYNRGMVRVYRGTAVVAGLCALVGLITSVLFARLLMRPIRALDAVMQRVALGDLSVWAEVRSGDEIQSLGDSFNAMTESLLHRDRVLGCVRSAAKKFLTTPDWREVIADVLENIADSAQCDIVYVAQNDPANGEAETLFRFPVRTLVVRHSLPWDSPDLAPWADRLSKGEICATSVGNAVDDGVKVLFGQDVKSIVLVPVSVEGQWWGVLGLEDRQRERDWTEAERHSLHATAGMLGATITRQRFHEALVEAKSTLENRVEERTRELREQVRAKEQALTRLSEAQNALLDLSRKTGMAEVATGVLHNVGNVLNSVNVSAGLLNEALARSQVSALRKACLVLEEHRADLGEFLAKDARGNRVLDYLSKLAAFLSEERDKAKRETQSLLQNIQHIKEIVAMQQSYAKVAGMSEDLQVSELVEDALRLHSRGLSRDGVELQRNYATVPPVRVDKHKVLQILLNLLANARQALNTARRADKLLTLGIALNGNNRVKVTIADNGVGIQPDHLTRIFQHGFTTKPDGHGFGLHSGALAAREMGGMLCAASDGPGRGALFALELPIATPLPKNV